ncbi:MAG TPA: hypothetical protein PLB28_07445 [Bacteroidales bacterium]|nr:hypothetical protein [Bacteroidales bacterium]
MAVTAEDVRKALEDMVYENLIDIFMVKGDATVLLAGADTSVAFIGDPYDSATDYILNIDEAVDVDGIDIRNAIEIKDCTANGFVFNSPRNTTAKWTAFRRTPKISLWTA